MQQQGLKYKPIYDRLHGVFCWFRIGDQETTMWDTGQDAQDLHDWCLTASPTCIDARAEREFEEQEI